MDGKTFARIGAIIFVAVAITATAVELTRKEEAPKVEFVPAGEGGAADPLRIALRRCRDMGEAAARDPACLRVWAENRDRFLGRSSAPADAFPASEEPLGPDAPAAGIVAPASSGGE